MESFIQKWVECKYNHEVHLLNFYFSSQIFGDFSKCQKNERKNSKVLPNLRSAMQGLDGTEKPKLVKRKDITNKI